MCVGRAAASSPLASHHAQSVPAAPAGSRAGWGHPSLRLGGSGTTFPTQVKSVWPQGARCPALVVKYYGGFSIWGLQAALQVSIPAVTTAVNSSQKSTRSGRKWPASAVYMQWKILQSYYLISGWLKLGNLIPTLFLPFSPDV